MRPAGRLRRSVFVDVVAVLVVPMAVVQVVDVILVPPSSQLVTDGNPSGGLRSAGDELGDDVGRVVGQDPVPAADLQDYCWPG